MAAVRALDAGREWVREHVRDAGERAALLDRISRERRVPPEIWAHASARLAYYATACSVEGCTGRALYYRAENAYCRAHRRLA